MSRFEFWAASLTPFDGAGRLALDLVPAQAEHLASSGVRGVFVNGTSGEFPAVTIDERVELLEAWVTAKPAGVSVGVHVGGVPTVQAAELAAHAQKLGVDLISTVAPFYGEAPTAGHLIDQLATVAGAASNTPFCYYQIPAMTGSTYRPSIVLAQAVTAIPTMAAVKFTDGDLMELDAITRNQPDLKIYFGRDELLPFALPLGLGSAIGSLYNGLAPVAHAVVDAFDRGDMQSAYALHKPFRDIAHLASGPGFVKELMNRLGPDAGPARSPWGPVTAADRATIDHMLPHLQDSLAVARKLVR